MKEETKNCQNCKKDFTIEPDDFAFYEKIKVPPPTFCFECRLQRKMARRNERSLYKRKCDLCHLDIIAMYQSETPFPVYCPKCWWGDGWDPEEYGKNYDFTKSFFHQWNELAKNVPRISLYQKNPVNSPFSNHSDNIKNSYLAFNSGLSEYLFYSNWIINSKELIDCYATFESELCYEMDNNKKCSRCSFLYVGKNNIDSSYLYDCNNCMNCFLSSNLRNKKLYFMNKQFSKEEYEEKIKEFSGSFIGRQKAEEIFYNDIMPKTLRKYMICGKQKNSSGDYIFGGSKNLKKCFRIYKASEDSAYSVDCADIKDCYDAYESAFNCEQQYDCHAGNRLSFSKFSSVSYDDHDIEYCEMCHDSEYLFGCISMIKKKYCILNKQYSKDDYFDILNKIKEQMSKIVYTDKKGLEYKYGEFFPIEFSPFCYNETVAQEYFPITKEKADKNGYKWKEKSNRNYKIDLTTKDLPDNIKDTNESIIDKVIECAHHGENDHKNSNCDDVCTEVFKIVADEFLFYKKMNLAIPRFCPNCRHYIRQKIRNPMKLWHRKCMKEGCDNEFETPYAPERPEIVYCESCYQKEVY
jgi:hypothetical protein